MIGEGSTSKSNPRTVIIFNGIATLVQFSLPIFITPFGIPWTNKLMGSPGLHFRFRPFLFLPARWQHVRSDSAWLYCGSGRADDVHSPAHGQHFDPADRSQSHQCGEQPDLSAIGPPGSVAAKLEHRSHDGFLICRMPVTIEQGD